MPAARYQQEERVAQLAIFLKALSGGKTVASAACDAGMDRRGLYRLRQKDARFRARWDAALEMQQCRSLDPLELEAERRAVEGTEKPVFRGGKIVGHVRDYSDSMLMFLLKARYPERYDRKSAYQEDTGASDLSGIREALLGKFRQATDRR